MYCKETKTTDDTRYKGADMYNYKHGVQTSSGRSVTSQSCLLLTHAEQSPSTGNVKDISESEYTPSVL